MRRALGFASGLVVAIVALLLMAPTGGFPSRPRFLAVGINTTAPTTAGTLSALANTNATITNAALDNDSNGTLNGSRVDINSGDVSLVYTVAGSGRTTQVITNGPIGAQATLRTLGAHPLIFGTNNTMFMQLEGDGDAFLYGATTEIDNAAPTYQLRENDQAADGKLWRIDSLAGNLRVTTRTDAGGAGNDAINIDRTGTTVDSIALASTALTFNGIAIATKESGTFTASFETACTATPTITYDWARSGDIVTLVPVSQAGFPCTGDSTAFSSTSTPLPAALRPQASFSSPAMPNFQDNSAIAWAQMTVGITGDISFNKCTAFTANCNSSGWTAALNRGAAQAQPFTYMIGNP